jgi:hypothetical protein
VTSCQLAFFRLRPETLSMQLPNSENAYVPREKLTGYLLSETHPIGKIKARYFRSLGYHDGNADELQGALIGIAQNHSVAETESTPHGEKYVIDGSLMPPSGRTAALRTVWIIEANDDRPRLVTAFPL